MTRRWMHLGCGPHLLSAPWENCDREVDISRPLPITDRTVEFIHAEHVIEHVPFSSGMAFLRECFRVLSPGGTLRLAFPDVTRFKGATETEEYLSFLRSIGKPALTVADVFRFILIANEHLSIWTYDGACAALRASGFQHVRQVNYGQSLRRPLVGIDCHHLSSPVAKIETTIIEATK